MAHKLRVTPEPTVVREVDDAELVDLARQGLIHSYEHTDAAATVLDTFDLRPSVAKWRDAGRGEEIVTPPPGVTDPAASATVDVDKKGA